VRITAQLIEAETGAHLWANRFDSSLDVSTFTYKSQAIAKAGRSLGVRYVLECCERSRIANGCGIAAALSALVPRFLQLLFYPRCLAGCFLLALVVASFWHRSPPRYRRVLRVIGSLDGAGFGPDPAGGLEGSM
jgi:hypothetical protein